MAHDIVLLDGGSGTSLWKMAGNSDPVWSYNVDNPEIVTELARQYVAAGSKVVMTNTFGANRLALEGSGYDVAQVVKAGVRLAREAVAGTDAKVALDIGPLSELMEPFGDLTEEEAMEVFEEQIGAGVEEGVDAIALETFMDLEMARVAAEVALRHGVPVMCTMTFGKGGRTMMGNSVQDIVAALEPLGVAAIGLNCGLGPDAALPIVREFAEATELPIVFKPNAGMPELTGDDAAEAAYTARRFAEEVSPAFEVATYVGGCCGTDPTYIAALKGALGSSRQIARGQ